MASRTGNAATSTELIPAGHAALTAEEELGEHQSDTSAGLAGLSVAALGVVFGDIGTSPVYTFRECFNPERGLPLDAEHVLGVLSMIFWALIIVVAVKYVLLIMRADNRAKVAFSPYWPWPLRRPGASVCALFWSCSPSAAPRCSTATV
jgi:K+ potassium transporter